MVPAIRRFFGGNAAAEGAGAALKRRHTPRLYYCYTILLYYNIRLLYYGLFGGNAAAGGAGAGLKWRHTTILYYFY